MIKEKQVYVKIGSWNHSHYKNLGYDNVKKGESVLVKVEDLTTGSHTLITAICEICGIEKILIYKTYLLNINRGECYYNCKKCQYNIMKRTLKQKYGVENVSFIPEVKDKIRIKNIENSKERYIKIKKTNLEKYGVENTFQSAKLMKVSLIKRQIDESLLTPWLKYRKEIMKLTYRHKKILFGNWNGYDYYDNQYIKDNYNLHYCHPDYPTIDHKISIRYGFDNNISVDEISDITNLCITKKRINTSKSTRNENEFINLLKIKLKNEKHR